MTQSIPQTRRSILFTAPRTANRLARSCARRGSGNIPPALRRPRLPNWHCLAAHGISNRALAGIGALSGQATKHFAVREFAGDKDPRYLPKIDGLAPLAHASADIPPILSVCGEPPWEWPGRSEENRLLIGSCVALGHPCARFVQCAYCDHGRTYAAALPFLEMFIHGELP